MKYLNKIKKRNAVLFLLLSLLCYSCNHETLFKGNFIFRQSGPSLLLQGEKIADVVPGFREVIIADTFLLAFTPANRKGLLSVGSTNTGKLLYKDLILKGRGPGEYLNIDYAGRETDSGKVKIWLGANGYRKLVRLNLAESLEKGRPVIEREIPCGPGAAAGVLGVFRGTGDLLLLYQYNMSEKNFNVMKYDVGNNIARKAGSVYNQPVDLTDGSAQVLYNPKYPYLVISSVFFNRIYFYDFTAPGRSFSVSTDKSPVEYEDLKRIPVSERELYYLSSFCTDEMLGFLYNRKGESFVQFWDWKGNLLGNVQLAQAATRISYSYPDSSLYASNFTEETVYKYDLSGLDFISR